MSYTIVERGSPGELVRAVEELKSKGWKCLGGIAIELDYPPEPCQSKYYQAMEKDDTLTEG